MIMYNVALHRAGSLIGSQIPKWKEAFAHQSLCPPILKAEHGCPELHTSVTPWSEKICIGGGE